MVVLIDGGTMHNFITTKLVTELQLAVLPSESYGVMLGTKGLIWAAGIHQGVVLNISN